MPRLPQQHRPPFVQNHKKRTTASKKIGLLAMFLLSAALVVVQIKLATIMTNVVTKEEGVHRVIQPLPRTEQEINYNRTLTLLVQLRGELCNHLSILARARLIQLYVQQQLPGIQVKLLGQHEPVKSWRWSAPKNDLLQCFPQFTNLGFEHGIWDTQHDFVDKFQKPQQTWLGDNATLLQDVLTLPQVEYLRQLLDLQNTGDPAVPPPEMAGSKYSMPYLTAFEFAIRGEVLNHVQDYRNIREFLKFDKQACCKQLPDDEESVFHFRNFRQEITQSKTLSESLLDKYSWYEMSPNDTAHFMFGPQHPLVAQQLQQSSNKKLKVAIISRFSKAAQPYAQALERLQDAAYQARVLTGQSGVQDFCVALATRASFVGLFSSTYAIWASILGNASKVRLYKVNHRNDNNTTTEPVLERQHVLDGREFWLETYTPSSLSVV